MYNICVQCHSVQCTVYSVQFCVSCIHIGFFLLSASFLPPFFLAQWHLHQSLAPMLRRYGRQYQLVAGDKRATAKHAHGWYV